MDLKRKIESVESRESKSSIAVKRKAPLKAELSLQLKSLQEKFNALENENQQNKETIKNLELKVKGLEEKTSWNAGESKIVKSVPVQTDEILLCHKCDYIGENIYELDAHSWTEHSPEEYLTCRYCENGFDSKSELMAHRKKHHSNRVNICRDFSNGVCPYVESVCWYNHSETTNTSSTVLTRSSCNICDEIFTSRSELMHHNKKKHKNKVPLCKKSIHGTCWFGNDNCWFIHQEVDDGEKITKDDEITKDKEMVAKIFDMMEAFTKRLIEIEQKV